MSDMRFHIALTSDHVAEFGWVHSVDEKNKEDRIAVKPKPADDYVGRPSNIYS